MDRDLVVLGTRGPVARIVTGHTPYDPNGDADAIFEWLSLYLPCSTFQQIKERFRQHGDSPAAR